MSHVAGAFTGIVRDKLAELEDGDGSLVGTAPTIANSTATDVEGLVADFNALLAALRSRGVLAS
ncbi:hypothetical protein KGD82_13570 [Nocardiopsis eucommiae]|uniref:Uncharacterized protein n=1 Tax=Nocardiopsis eucommiae TaxID=2831970 RepID=A0A975LD43_9ACTN|nr:hypothetical protein KGD82_13570 [Nocardiopsis eucommiae]